MPGTRMETVQAGGGSFEAHLTLPDRGRGPGLLLLQEIFGVNEFVEGKAADLAALGYVVLAPDVFWRVRPGLSLAHDDSGLEEAFAVMGRYAEEVPQEAKTADLLDALGHLRSLPEVTEGVGAVGYCLGGSLAYFVAAAGDLDVAVAYYGSMIPGHLAQADRISCPILFHFGGADPYIPAEQVAEVQRAFEGRADAEVRIYEGAGHAFENLLAPRFADPGAASSSWPVTVDWLRRYLPPGG